MSLHAGQEKKLLRGQIIIAKVTLERALRLTRDACPYACITLYHVGWEEHLVIPRSCINSGLTTQFYFNLTCQHVIKPEVPACPCALPEVVESNQGKQNKRLISRHARFVDENGHKM